MNGNNIYIEKNNLLDAYKKGNADNKKMLENLFGKEMFRPKNIMEFDGSNWRLIGYAHDYTA